MQTHINYDGLEKLFLHAAQSKRNFLYEYEVYDLVRLSGGETPPRFSLLKSGERFEESLLDALPGDKVVIKVVSPHILHKSDVGGVQICEKKATSVLSTMRRMSCTIPEKLAARVEVDASGTIPEWQGIRGKELVRVIEKDIDGFLICQYMRPDSEQFGGELLLGLRNTREFGMILTAGLGGRDTELYAKRFRKGQAVASASVAMMDGDRFFELFQQTISYRKLAGLTRGQQRIVTDNQLLECFTAFIELGRYFSAENGAGTFLIEELEINPFAFSDFLMMPLDGLCRFTQKPAPPIARPIQAIDHLLHPVSIGLAGCSASKMNVGRIILQNILAAGYDREKITVIHPRTSAIENIPTITSLTDLKAPLDLLILAVSGALIPEMIDQVMAGKLASGVILIAGSLGEKSDEEAFTTSLKHTIHAARSAGDNPPVFLGANSLGILSQPGHYDSIFIPESKLAKIRGDHPRNVALVSQSGAYLITRMSRLAFLDPAYAISVGNQIDLSVGDFLHYFNQQEELTTLGFYIEGFNDFDGLSCLHAIAHARSQGREVIFYKAGRTPEGKNALSSHTASIAGDYSVCESCIDQAGAMVAATFSEFEGLLQLSCSFHSREINGNRLAAVSNAGYEAVGIADNILGVDFRLHLAEFSPETHARLGTLFTSAGLASLVEVSNPLDITPMAKEEVYVEVIRTLLDDNTIDVIIAAIVPLTPMLHTLPTEIEPGKNRASGTNLIEQIGQLWDTSKKPIVMVVDSGALYDPLAKNLQERGLPVFRSADIAVRVLGRYLRYRRTSS